MAEIITAADLPASLQAHELVDVLVAGANAKASRVAPCLVDAATANEATPEQKAALDEARLVLIGAVKRWADAGSGALTAQAAGPFSQSYDTRQRTGYNLWPSEITDLQGICSADSPGREAFSIDTAPHGVGDNHAEICSIRWGDTCSCGAILTRGLHPLYELD